MDEGDEGKRDNGERREDQVTEVRRKGGYALEEE